MKISEVSGEIVEVERAFGGPGSWDRERRRRNESSAGALGIHHGLSMPKETVSRGTSDRRDDLMTRRGGLAEGLGVVSVMKFWKKSE